MMGPFDEAEYLPIPEISPYVRHDRYETPKEVFKHVARTLERLTEPGQSYHLADIACANGEMLYYLRQRFPRWRLEGHDLTPEFIETGRAFPGLAGVELHVRDLYEVTGRFDVVTLINLMTTVWEPERPLLHLLSLVREGGWLLVDGCFNRYDIEFRAVFMDNSHPASAGKWRRDYSQHSRRSIARILEGRCRSFAFEEIPMNVAIPRRPGDPANHTWTFRDEHGKTIMTNGTGMMMEKTLLVVQR